MLQPSRRRPVPTYKAAVVLEADAHHAHCAVLLGQGALIPLQAGAAGESSARCLHVVRLCHGARRGGTTSVGR